MLERFAQGRGRRISATNGNRVEVEIRAGGEVPRMAEAHQLVVATRRHGEFGLE